MKINKKLVATVLCFAICFVIFAQEDEENAAVLEQEGEKTTANPEYAKVELKVDIPVFDFPYQTDVMQAMIYNFWETYSGLSMNQSLKLTTGVYSAMHYGLKKMYDSLNFTPFWNNAIYYSATAAGFPAYAYVLPFGYPWMKYEFKNPY